MVDDTVNSIWMLQGNEGRKVSASAEFVRPESVLSPFPPSLPPSLPLSLPQTVDQTKLDKAEAKLKQKQEKRSTKESNTKE